MHPMPAAFYDLTIGIEPVDVVIRRVLRHAYCHHIERLMILGNFMLLCEIDPAAVYRWFMELFIDAYDWVMVPNVYGMSQHADGGLITTKPYISGSSYLFKMSRFRRGTWCEVWDARYWRFIHCHRDFFADNPRMSVMVSACDRLGDKLHVHLRTAEEFLRRLHAKAAAPTQWRPMVPTIHGEGPVENRRKAKLSGILRLTLGRGRGFPRRERFERFL